MKNQSISAASPITHAHDDQDLEKASLRSVEKAPASQPGDASTSRSSVSRFFARVTYFLTLYGIETAGWVIY